MKKLIPDSTIKFLKDLKKNNNRDWFNKYKNRYLSEHGNVVAFADVLLLEIKKYDNIETASGKKSLHRIYRDTRFFNDKTPYKTNFSGGFKRATNTISYYKLV